MNRDAPRFAFRLDEQQRLLAEHEHRRAAEKMRGDDRRPGSDGRVRSAMETVSLRSQTWSATQCQGLVRSSIRQFDGLPRLMEAPVKAADDEPGGGDQAIQLSKPGGSFPPAVCGR